MNKGITILILFTVLGAMGLVFYSHTRQPGQLPSDRVRDGHVLPADNAREGLNRPGSPLAGGSALPPPAVGGQTGGSPLRAPQDGSGGLKQIDPPLTSGQTAVDGAPAPIRITAGNTGIPARTSTPPPVRPPVEPELPVPSGPSGPDAAEADRSGRGAAGRAGGGSPELTPWVKPSNATTATRPAREERPPEAASPQTRPPAPSAPAPVIASTPAPVIASTPAPVAAPPPDSKPLVLSDKDSHVLTDIGLHFSGQAMQLRIEADSPFPCRTFVLNAPDRLVIDLPGVWKGVKAPAVPQNRLVRTVRVGAQASGPRIVLDLSSAPREHQMVRNGAVVEIMVQ